MVRSRTYSQTRKSFQLFCVFFQISMAQCRKVGPCKSLQGHTYKPDRKNVDFSRFFSHLPYDDSLDFIMVYHNLLLLLLLRARLHLLLLLLTTASWPQPRAPDLSEHSTTSTRSQWAPPDLNREHQISWLRSGSSHGRETENRETVKIDAR